MTPGMALQAEGASRDRARLRGAVGTACAWLSFAVGAAVLGAWLARPLLQADGSFLWLMKANTALCVTCTSLGMLLLVDARRDGAGHLRRGLGALVCALSVATLFQYLSGIDLGVDQLLVTDPAPSLPGRMSPWTAATLALFASALLGHRARHLDWIADVALVAAGATLQVIFAGYLYGVVDLYGLDRFTRVSPQTLLCLAALWVALVAGRLGVGSLEIATRPSAGGAAVRVLLPIALVLPPLLGWVRLVAQREGLISSTHVGVALFAVAQTLILAALVYGFAFRLDAFEARYVAERLRREGLERLVAICAWTGKVRWNGEWVRVERYLMERFGLHVTHTISDDAMERMQQEIAKLESTRDGEG